MIIKYTVPTAIESHLEYIPEDELGNVITAALLSAINKAPPVEPEINLISEIRAMLANTQSVPVSEIAVEPELAPVFTPVVDDYDEVDAEMLSAGQDFFSNLFK